MELKKRRRHNSPTSPISMFPMLDSAAHDAFLTDHIQQPNQWTEYHKFTSDPHIKNVNELLSLNELIPSYFLFKHSLIQCYFPLKQSCNEKKIKSFSSMPKNKSLYNLQTTSYTSLNATGLFTFRHFACKLI